MKRICIIAQTKIHWLIIDENNYVVQNIDKAWFQLEGFNKRYAQFKSIDKWANDPVGTYYYFDISDESFCQGKKV